MERRRFNLCLLGAGLCSLCSASLWARESPDLFNARTQNAVIHLLFGDIQPIESDSVHLELPYQVQAGQRVSASVSYSGHDAQVIALITTGNTHPLSTYINLSGAGGFYSTLLRVSRSSQVTAYVKTADALYATTTHIKVSQGGYGAFTGPEEAVSERAPQSEIKTKLRIRRDDRNTSVQALVTHPMLAGDAQAGDSQAGHFIARVRFSLNDEQVAEAHLGPDVASQPITGIQLPRANPGDRVAVEWTDNVGISGHAESPVY
ncbi:MAG: thiosulfate oxidation carrier complex protein SoxZ [Candidatus Thiodiazotropha sp.]